MVARPKKLNLTYAKPLKLHEITRFFGKSLDLSGGLSDRCHALRKRKKMRKKQHKRGENGKEEDMREVKKIGPVAAVIRRKRVAAYARVSSGKDAMLHSLSAQVSYYNNLIGKRGDFEFAGIYADEALTGTKAERPEFQRLLTDCRAGKIDMVITKSVTRFARNTVTLLEATRELKLLGIDVFFERENIHTLSADGELMLTLLASFAQEESRSASENQKWRIRRMFKAGLPTYTRLLGYKWEDGGFRVVPEEAAIVKQIFADYLSGMGKLAIAKKLNSLGVPTRNGKPWSENTVAKILRNEKYAGDVLLQKSFIADCVTKKKRVNCGELPKYHVPDSHEAIVSRETYDAVRTEIQRRASLHEAAGKPVTAYPFTGLLKCGNCGKSYNRKHTAAGTKYEKVVWICKTFNRLGKSHCRSQQIPEDILLAKTAETLGLTDITAEALAAGISRILVSGHNKLVFVFHDGKTAEAEWQNPSRRESWTPEMKQIARDRQIEINKRRREYGNTGK
jgi:DNA invertase Pin-like site-specific DNA recombinase